MVITAVNLVLRYCLGPGQRIEGQAILGVGEHQICLSMKKAFIIHFHRECMWYIISWCWYYDSMAWIFLLGILWLYF